MRKYPELFTGIGVIPGICCIELVDNIEPYSVHTPRSIPIPLWEKVRAEIQCMVDQKIITNQTAKIYYVYHPI